MALKKKGNYWYGETVDDIRSSVARYSDANGYEAVRFAQSVCACGGQVFRLATDEDEGVARRECLACGAAHLMGDSAEFAAQAECEGHVCVCDADAFLLLSGVALYPDSDDVRWYYIGCQCTQCQLTGVFADWKCEAGDAASFLARV